jgi:short-subunit dehydrogenase
MTTIAIIGAGPGLGQATARRFGREGYSVALISRTQENVDRLAAEASPPAATARRRR